MVNDQQEAQTELPLVALPKYSPDWVPDFRYELEPRYLSWRENFHLAFMQVPPWIPLPRPFSTISTDFTRDRQRRGLKGSIALHCCFVLVAVLSSFGEKFQELSPEQENARLIYELKNAHQVIYLPPLKPKGDGGNPGKGLPKPLPAKQGSTMESPRIQLVSNPPRPDNQKQTIRQEPAAPDIRLPREVPLPNMVFASNAVPVAPPPPVRSPSIRLAQTPVPAAPQPAAKPARQPDEPREITAPGNVVADLSVRNLPAVSSPVLPLPPPPMPEPVRIAVQADAGSLESMTGLIVASVVPGPPAARAEIPPGNREADFAIAPGGRAGAVGASAEGLSSAGQGGPGSGGDASAGVGPGQSGGGGGEATRLVASISSSGNGAGAAREGVVMKNGEPDALPATVPATKVFPVEVVPKTQGKGMVINAGPVGGGGLNVYGVLRGGKISTTYLAMPNKNWTLQFSLNSGKASGADVRTVQWNSGARQDISPPFPLKRFDFMRPPLPAEKSRMMIVLHGMISAEGRVSDLQVIKGVGSEVDELAVEAFSQWVFRPASIEDRATAVEILVGIPAGNVAASAQARPSSITLP